MARPRVEKQTHIRVFVSDKRVLDTFMKRKGVKSQAVAFRMMLRRKRRPVKRRFGLF